MQNRAIYITHAKRTAVGSFLGSLSSMPAHKLGSVVIKSILNDSRIDPAIIGEVILGQVITGGSGQNSSRQTLIDSGIPKEIPAFTINKVCGSSLKAVILATQSIAACNDEIILAGGQENMSLGMHASYIRAGAKFGDIKMVDLMQYDGLTDVFSGVAMGVTAENIARLFNITREQQDAFALFSHQKAAKAQIAGRFKDEIVPVEIIIKKQQMLFEKDEGIRFDANLESMQKLRPVFNQNGSVTAGNSSSINDGAAALMVTSEKALKDFNLTPLVRIVSYASTGVDPSIMGIGPISASKKALDKAGWKIEDLDLIEVNEAFAAQSVYVNQEMNWDLNKVNVNGGAIALGHPIGASGARVLVTLIHQMKYQSAKRALISMCIGGGMGIAMCLENT